jgi:hypothetical protein
VISASLQPLPENDGLAFVGERAWVPGALTRQRAQALSGAINPSGRPNLDVLRGFVGLENGRITERWQIDFPAHLTDQEASLYHGPYAMLQQRPGTMPSNWRQNPHANPALRNALARVDRYLITPAARDTPAWAWLEGNWLPDDSLLAVARDDDFTHGVLQSRLFTLWWAAHRPHHALALIVNSFPFPWAPATPLSKLTGIQQDLRFEISRHARSQAPDQNDGPVTTAYGWSGSLDDAELLARLTALHQRRMKS